MKKIPLHFFLLLLLTAIAPQLHALTPIVDSIPMRDSTKLAADIYLSPNSSAPTILVQTPYNRLLYRTFGLPLYGFDTANMPYNFVILDWRCFYGSASACVALPNHGQDGYDAVQWITAQTWSDGQVAGWGPSALGVVQFQTAKEQPAGLKCIIPIVAAPNYAYQDYFYGGVYRTEYVETLDVLGYGMSPFLLANQYYNFTWQYLESTSNYPTQIAVPALMIGGWYDHNTEEVLGFFNGIRTSSPLSVRDEHRLLMGPWTHKSVGLQSQGSLSYPGAEGWSDSLAIMFLDYHLRGISNGWNSTPYVQYFQMGDDTWLNASSWPPTGLSGFDVYLHPGGLLDANPPANATGSATYAYDPHNPSPTYGGPTLSPSLQEGPVDQAPVVETRNDILIFSSLVLGQDVIMKGNATATLYVSSDQYDTDFSIRLTDVYPDGRSMLVLDGIARMRFRNGFSTADTASMVPGTVYPITIEMPASAITFKAGHRIRVDITSSNYPRFDSNLNNGGAMYTAGDTNVANNTVYFNTQYPSHINLQLVDFVGSTAENNLQTNNAIIYPNPSAGNATLSFTTATAGAVTVELTDLAGKRVWHKTENEAAGEHDWLLPASLPAGTYLARIITNSDMQTLRYVKMR